MAEQKIIDRIVKLFRLGDKSANTTEAEMMLAVTKARELMAQHNLTMADIAEKKGQSIADSIRDRIRQHPAYTRKGTRLADYDWQVAYAVGILTDTRVIQTWTQDWLGGKFVSAVFVGVEEDTALAGELFILWLKQVRAMARRVYGSGNTWGKRHTSYAVGVGYRLQERARRMVQTLSAGEQETMALVVQTKQSSIERWIANNLNMVDKKQRASRLDDDALLRGYQDGAQFNMETRIIK